MDETVKNEIYRQFCLDQDIITKAGDKKDRIIGMKTMIIAFIIFAIKFYKDRSGNGSFAVMVIITFCLSAFTALTILMCIHATGLRNASVLKSVKSQLRYQKDETKCFMKYNIGGKTYFIKPLNEITLKNKANIIPEENIICLSDNFDQETNGEYLIQISPDYAIQTSFAMYHIIKEKQEHFQEYPDLQVPILVLTEQEYRYLVKRRKIEIPLVAVKGI